MKKTIQLTLALLIGTTMAFATNPEDPEGKKVKVTKERAGVYTVTYKMSEPSKVQVLILNNEGVTVHRDILNRSKSFTKSYNLTNFSSGDYTFKVDDATNSSTATVTYDKSQGIVLYKMGDTHKVKLIAAVPNQKLTINIYDLAGELIQVDHITTKDEGAQRVYNIQNRQSGQTKIEVINGFEVVQNLVL
jgi:hypothetical protein